MSLSLVELFTIHSLQVSFFFLVALGFLVGLLSGLLGVGGGILLTPALHVLGLSMPIAVATTLAQMVASSITGTWRHIRHGNTVYGLTLVFGFPALFGVIIGRQLMVYWARLGVADSWTSSIYTVLLVYVSVQMLRRTRRAEKASLSGASVTASTSWLTRFWSIGPKISFSSIVLTQ